MLFCKYLCRQFFAFEKEIKNPYSNIAEVDNFWLKKKGAGWGWRQIKEAQANNLHTDFNLEGTIFPKYPSYQVWVFKEINNTEFCIIYFCKKIMAFLYSYF